LKELSSCNISVTQYRSYMSDVYSYAMHSSQVIALAGSRIVLSHPALAQYLFRHAEEELGHEKWAATDLQDLGLSSSEIEKVVPSSPCIRMIALEYFYAGHANPIGLFGWMFVLESIGGESASGIAQTIDNTLKLNGKGTYFLRGHGDADAQHSEDLVTVVDANVKTKNDVETFLFAAEEAASLYCSILDHAFDVHLLADEALAAS
jgi:heme oxygenase